MNHLALVHKRHVNNNVLLSMMCQVDTCPFFYIKYMASILNRVWVFTMALRKLPKGWRIMNELIILLTFAVSAIKFGQGLETERKQTLNPWLITRSVIAVIILVPILFSILILIFKPPISVTYALIIMACAPAANLSNQSISILGGDNALADRIELITALISIITTPILLEFMELITGINLNLSVFLMIGQLALTQFLPMVLGIYIRKRFPKYIIYAKYILRCASFLLIIIFILLIILYHQFFTQLRIQGYVIIIIATIAAFLLGIFFADKSPKKQISLAVETGLRNPGLVYLIASENFLEVNSNQFIIPYTVTVLVTIISCSCLLKLIHKNRC